MTTTTTSADSNRTASSTTSEFGGACRSCPKNPRLLGENQGRWALIGSVGDVGMVTPLTQGQSGRDRCKQSRKLGTVQLVWRADVILHPQRNFELSTMRSLITWSKRDPFQWVFAEGV